MKWKVRSIQEKGRLKKGEGGGGGGGGGMGGVKALISRQESTGIIKSRPCPLAHQLAKNWSRLIHSTAREKNKEQVAFVWKTKTSCNLHFSFLTPSWVIKAQLAVAAVFDSSISFLAIIIIIII